MQNDFETIGKMNIPSHACIFKFYSPFYFLSLKYKQPSLKKLFQNVVDTSSLSLIQRLFDNSSLQGAQGFTHNESIMTKRHIAPTDLSVKKAMFEHSGILNQIDGKYLYVRADFV